MISIDILSGLTPFVQLVLVVGLFTMLLLIAFNRAAGTNLAAFLREIYSIYSLHSQHKRLIPSQGEGKSEVESKEIPPEIVKGNSVSQLEQRVSDCSTRNDRSRLMKNT